MRILLTGATGVIGSEVDELLSARRNVDVDLARTARRRSPAGDAVRWNIGTQPTPPEVRGEWDVIVHLAASTRWTMTRAEAYKANVAPLAAVLSLATERTHLVHVSTAYVVGPTPGSRDADPEYDAFRNGYEWSKAASEALVRERHAGPLTIVRPPLVVGRRRDGRISRFTGLYTLFQTFGSGLAAVVVGEPDGYVEIAPVDQVAEVVVDAALGPPPAVPTVETVAAGTRSLRLAPMLSIIIGALNEWRVARGLMPINEPPLVTADRWHRFFLPLAEQHLSPIQHHAIQLLGMFEGYTSMARPFEPTRRVADPADVLWRSVRFWAETRQRSAARTPEPWRIDGSVPSK